MNKISLILIFALCFCLQLSFAETSQEGESITITTYYPSPYGVYKNMRIYPSEKPGSSSPANQPGTLYFDSTEEKMYVYKNDTDKWQALGGGDTFTKITLTPLSSPPVTCDAAHKGTIYFDSSMHLMLCQCTNYPCSTYGWVNIQTSNNFTRQKTVARYTGNLGGLAGADAKCEQEFGAGWRFARSAPTTTEPLIDNCMGQAAHFNQPSPRDCLGWTTDNCPDYNTTAVGVNTCLEFGSWCCGDSLPLLCENTIYF
jgi:hypothetical protein